MTTSNAVRRSLSRLANLTEQEDPAFVDYRRKVDRLRTLHLPMRRREEALKTRMKALIAHVLSGEDDGSGRGEGNYLAILGPSGAGKTRLCERVFATFEGLATFEDEEGTCRPLITVRAPRPCGSREFAIILLHALGISHDNFPGLEDMSRVKAWGMVRRLLAESGTLIIHIDEFQHVAAAEPEDAEEVVDTLKNVSQQNDHPISLVLSGLPEIRDFIAGHFANTQITRRDRFFEIPRLDIERDRVKLTEFVGEIAAAAGLEDRTRNHPDFLDRLAHASTNQLGRFGIVATLAANEALLLRDEVLEPGHFAEAIRLLTLCPDESNVFLVSDWPDMSVWPDDDAARRFVAEDEDAFYANGRKTRKKSRTAAATPNRIAAE